VQSEGRLLIVFPIAHRLPPSTHHPITLSFSAENQLLSQTLRTEDPLSPRRLIPWTLSQHRFSVPSDQIADIVGQVYHTQRPPLSS